MSTSLSSRAEILYELARRLRLVERSGGGASFDGPEARSTGIEGLDRLLPDGGLFPGALTEWITEGTGSGAQWLSSKIAAHALAAEPGQAFVVIDSRSELYPPAAAALGIDLRNVLVVRSRRAADALWALEQALRCPGVAATLARLDRLDDRTFRRLQRAAEAGGGWGFLLRPSRAARVVVGDGAVLDHPPGDSEEKTNPRHRISND